MSKDNFFENEPPKHLDNKILKAADVALAENRKAHLRRKVLGWLAIPAAALAGLALFFKVNQENENNDDLQVAEFFEWKEIETDEQELVGDLEIIEDLEILEKWEES